MDPNATPWRVLEDPVGVPSPGAPSDEAASGSRWAGGRTTLAIGAAAVAVAIGAFVLAAGTGAGGSVVVDGASALPGASGGGLVHPGGSNAADVSGAGALLVVEIVGAVDRPGVYRLPSGARVGDLVVAAGGYGPRVDTDRAGRDLNLAAPLRDGDQIRVPSRGEAISSVSPTTGGGQRPAKPGGAPSAPIDLNRATAEELDTLPGVGPATAAKILASRDDQPFASVADLRSRKLVGEKTFANLKDLVAVR